MPKQTQTPTRYNNTHATLINQRHQQTWKTKHTINTIKQGGKDTYNKYEKQKTEANNTQNTHTNKNAHTHTTRPNTTQSKHDKQSTRDKRHHKQRNVT